MHVVRVVVEFHFVEIGDICVNFIFGRGRDARRAVDLAFLPRLFREVARHEVVGFAFVHQIKGYRRELLARAALYEDDAIIFGNIQKIS